jgi:hypothetical protein
MISSSLEGSRDHASHTQLQESEREKMMNATSGQKCLEQFEKFNRPGLWAKTFAGLLIGQTGWYSTRCKLNWKLKATKSSRFYFQLQVSTLPTKDTEHGLLPTPVANPGNRTLNEEGKNIDKNGNRYGANLNQMAKSNLLQTPTNSMVTYQDFVQAGFHSSKRPEYSKIQLPTPTARDFRHSGSQKGYKKRKGKHVQALNEEVCWGPQGIGTGGQLSPLFVMSMMGFPENWTLLPFLNGETNH